MMTAGVQPHVSAAPSAKIDLSLQSWLLKAGIISAILYPLADIFASTRYPGFSYRDQAVSELFAIGAPTSGLVVPLFTLSSSLLLLFAFGIWMSANGRRLVQWIAVMMAFNAIDALVLWNVFPMHMRGQQQTFTDMMHGILAVDPFLLAATVLATVAFRGRFRRYTIANIVITSALAVFSMRYVAAIIANQPTPWMGATERAAQYATNVWYAVFAVMLLRTQQLPAGATTPQPRSRPIDLPRFALVCGALSSLLYAAMLTFVPLAWSGYSSASQTVNELSAIGAPSRMLWVSLGFVWMLLYAAFGWGVWESAGQNRALRIAGLLMFAAAIIGIFWPPMHVRDVLAAGGGSLTDTMHIVWAAINGLITLLAMAFGAAAFGRRFRLYSIATMVVLIAAGVVTSMDAPQMQANLSTPWMGVWERINIGVWLLWVAVLSVMLWRSIRIRSADSVSERRVITG
jgi:hypothetical protein